MPAFPGSASATPTTTRPSDASTSGAGDGMAATASTGWGVTVEPSRSSTPSFRCSIGTPASLEAGGQGHEGDVGVGGEERRLERGAPVERGVDGPRPLDDERALGSPRLGVVQQRTQPFDRPAPRAALAGLDPVSRFEGFPRRGHEGAERGVVAHREVGEDLAVDVDLRRLQAGDEAASTTCRADGRPR